MDGIIPDYIARLLGEVLRLNKTVEPGYKYVLSKDNTQILRVYIGGGNEQPAQPFPFFKPTTPTTPTNSAFLGLDFSKPQTVVSVIVVISLIVLLIKRGNTIQ